MVMIWLVTAIVATVVYHLVLKVTPVAASPLLSLAVTYAVVTVVFTGAFFATPGSGTLRVSLQALNWTAIALAGVIVCLDFGFLMLYRSGFNVSLGQLVTQSVATLVLLIVGVAYFRERLSLANVAGILLCVVGLWLVSRR